MIKKLLKWASFLVLSGILLVVVLIAIALHWPVEKLSVPKATPQLLLTNVAVVDLEAGKIHHKQHVLIRQGKIVDIAAASPAAGKAKVVDMSGKYVIPGLWDMHVHSLRLFPQLQAPLYIASGVLRIRDMKGCYIKQDPLRACHPDKTSWNKSARSGKLVAPIFMGKASFSVNGPMKVYAKQNPIYNCSNAKEARALVRHFKAQGHDFIKVFSKIPRKAYFALMDEAKKQGITVAGHLPRTISTQEASDAGQKSIEHAFLFLWDCYPDIARFRKKGLKGIFLTKNLRKVIDQSDAKRCEALFQRLVKNKTYVCPTHTTRKMDAFADNKAYRNDPRLKNISPLFRKQWQQDADSEVKYDSSKAGRKAVMDFYRKGLELTGKAHRAGVKILAGTDASDSYCFPGSGLQDELEELVKAGLSPLHALRAATVVPAEYFGLEKTHGLVKKGYKAELVILDANPLEKIGHTRKIHAVYHQGRLYHKKDLTRMLAFVEGQVKRADMQMKLLWQAITRSFK